MIIGDYYINDYLVVGVFLVLLLGGAGYVGGGVVPGIGDNAGDNEDNRTEDDRIDEYNVELDGQEDQNFDSGSSQVIRFVDGDGDPVSDADVSVNGEDVGVTDEDGEASFEFPGGSNVTVTAGVSEGEVSRSFELEDGTIVDSEKTVSTSDDSSGGTGEDSDSSDTNEGSDAGDNGSEEGKEDEGGVEGSDGTSDETSDSENDSGSGEGNSGSEDGSGSENAGSESGSSSEGNGGSEEDSGSSGDTEEVSNEDLNATLGSSDYLLISGQSFTFNASNSTGDISYYYWQFGDGSTAVTGEPEATNTFYEKGEYEVFVVAVGSDGEQDYANASLEVVPPLEPEISVSSPEDGLKTNESFLDYDFDIENASDVSEYILRIDGDEVVSGGLEGGSNSIQTTLNVPSEVFNTSVRVVQDRKIYDSEKITVNATEAPENPVSNLEFPRDGNALGMNSSSLSVDFEYELVNSTWAEKVNFSVYNRSEVILEKEVSTSPGNYTENVSDLARGEYNYSLIFSDGENTWSEVNSFRVGQNEPEYSVEVNRPENQTHIGDRANKSQNITFNISYESDSAGLLKVEVNTSEKEENNYTLEGQEFNVTYDEDERVFNESMEISEGEEGFAIFEKQFNVSAVYDWKSWVEVDGEQADDATERHQFNVTEEPCWKSC